MTIIKLNEKKNFNKVKKLNLSNTASFINKNNKNFIFFSKYELTSILNLYSKQVSRGFWITDHFWSYVRLSTIYALSKITSIEFLAQLES